MKTQSVCVALVLSLVACGRGPAAEDGAGSASGPVRAGIAAMHAVSRGDGAGSAVARPGQVSPTELEVIEHTVSVPPRGKDDKENYWLQYQIWGEMKNRSAETLRDIVADVTLYDASGRMIDIHSIGTASKQDVGDHTPGETVRSEVHDIPPGASVPFHFMRNLAAIRGVPASHKITLRPARVSTHPTRGVAVGVREQVGEMANPALPHSHLVSRMRAFEGSIKNEGASGCRDPKVVVAFLSPDGKIKELHSIDARNDQNYKLVLAPGESVPFKGAVYASFDDAWREAAPVKSYVDCEEPY